LLVYAFQMVVSYLLGQKYYPIHYNLLKFWLFLGVAILFYSIAHFMNLDELKTKFIVHNGLILLYLLMIYTVEKPSFKKVGSL